MRGVNVHERTAQILAPEGSAPNALHKDLLRLFRAVERIRLVTTNFDTHFETASSELFGANPEVYRAPALPLGGDFSGIVHVHGALSRARDLVLTDADFGRAYLTEGWARRFLVEVFRKYTVLFVGYSHDDLVMNYLARALPAEGDARRFALIDKADEGKGGDWRLLGIRTIYFARGDEPEPFEQLYEGVARLAEHAGRGALEWQSRLAELGRRIPPEDEEAADEIGRALLEEHTTRFLLEEARTPEWLLWLNGRKKLDALFSTGDLEKPELLLADWLAENFVIDHPDEVFAVLSAQGLRVNGRLWEAILRQLAPRSNAKDLEEPALKRWVSILLTSMPADVDSLIWLAERCARQGFPDLTLKVFLSMSRHRLQVQPGFVQQRDDGSKTRHLEAACPLFSEHWSLSEVWKHLRPHVARLAQPVLSGVVRRLDDMHAEQAAWDSASREWDPVSHGRSAIEPHEQDRHPEAVHVLIDAARDALESLTIESPALLETWIELLVTSEAPLLRRLAVHATTKHQGLSPGDHLRWLQDRVGLHDVSARHEIYQAVALSYPAAPDLDRKAVVDAILAHRRPGTDEEPTRRTDRWHFSWLSWLTRTKPDCEFVGAALAPLKERYPQWEPSSHPDFSSWTESFTEVRSASPWSVEQLLARQPVEQLDDLLAATDDDDSGFVGPSRSSLLGKVREACRQRPPWAFALTDALVSRGLWPSDLWWAVLSGLRESDLSVNDWRVLLSLASKLELQSAHAADLAELLYALVKNDGKPFALELLEQANTIALTLWHSLDHARDAVSGDWLSRAVNSPSGVLVEFWLHGLSLALRGKAGPERTLPSDYRKWLTLVVRDTTSKGSMGRTLLASQVAFLFGLDEAWTRAHVIPLFNDSDDQKFAQAWDGFLMWGRLYPELVEALMPALLTVLQRYRRVQVHRWRLADIFASIAVFHTSDPTQDLLPALFQHGPAEDRAAFASRLGFILKDMEESARQRLWDDWLRRYWQNRLNGLPVALQQDEVQQMLRWLLHLGDIFPEAVNLAVRFPKDVQILDLFELRESDLVPRFPEATAHLLVYLANAQCNRVTLAAVDSRLPPIHQDLRLQLDEALARAGVRRRRD